MNHLLNITIKLVAKYFLIPLLICLILSCSATAPVEHLNNLNSISDQKIIKSIYETKNIQPIKTIGIKELIKSSIEANDPVVELNDNGQTFRTNFEIYKFHAMEDSTYNICIRSFCYKNCSGAKKYNMIPIVYIMNGSHSQISNPLKDFKSLTRMEGIVIKYYLFGRGVFKPEKTEDYYIIIASDNRFAGKNIGDINIKAQSLYYNMDVGFPISGYTYGDYEAWIE